MKKIFFLILCLLMAVSCKTPSVATSKLEGYNKQIENHLTVFIAVGYSKEKIEWSEGMQAKLVKEFSERGITADVIIFEPKEAPFTNTQLNYTHADIKTKNANGLTLLIRETEMKTEGNFYQSKFLITLTDHTLAKDVWKTEISMPFKNVLGGINAVVNASSKILLKALEDDRLLNK